ncbi:hypothetical protein D3C78_429500 [compost metagenome]
MGEQHYGNVDQQVDQCDSMACRIALGIGINEISQGNTHLYQPGSSGQGATGQWQECVEQQPTKCLPALPARCRSTARLCLEVPDRLFDAGLVEPGTYVCYRRLLGQTRRPRSTERYCEIVFDGQVEVGFKEAAVGIDPSRGFGQALEQVVLQISRAADGLEHGQAIRKLQ